MTQAFPETYDRSIAAPRLGAAYAMAGGATLRGAYQKWLRPASYNSLAPVATAGIPIDDSLVYPGGMLSRYRGQLDWELSPAWFMTAFADRQDVDNLSSPLDGVLNTRADVANLDRLRQRTVPNLAAPDQLEATPIFSRGSATSGGFTVNHVVSRNLAGYFGYAYTSSENTSATYSGKKIPYLPRNRATLGLTWAGDQRVLVERAGRVALGAFHGRSESGAVGGRLGHDAQAALGIRGQALERGCLCREPAQAQRRGPDRRESDCAVLDG